MEQWRELVLQWGDEYVAVQRANKAWERERDAHGLRILSNPRLLSDREHSPESGWQWEENLVQVTKDDLPSDHSSWPIHAPDVYLAKGWVPPKLATQNRPASGLALPLRPAEEIAGGLSINAKAAALAAVHDKFCKGTAPINPRSARGAAAVDKARPLQRIGWRHLQTAVKELTDDDVPALEAFLGDVRPALFPMASRAQLKDALPAALARKVNEIEAFDPRSDTDAMLHECTRRSWPAVASVPENRIRDLVRDELQRRELRPPWPDGGNVHCALYKQSGGPMILDLLHELEQQGTVERVTGAGAEYEQLDGRVVTGETAWRPKGTPSLEKLAPPTAARMQPEVPSDSDYHSADWFEINHGIRSSRLSEKSRDTKVRTKPAPKGFTDVEGMKPRMVYHVGDALKNCSPKRVTQKTRRKLPLGGS